MSISPISAVLGQADRDTVMAAIATIKEKLSFLIDLSGAERQALPKMGDKSRAFVSKALEVATQNPDFLPRSFDLEEMRKDVQLFEALYPLLLSLTQVQELVDDTYSTFHFHEVHLKLFNSLLEKGFGRIKRCNQA